MADSRKKQWTLLELLEWTSNYLSEKEFEDARLQTERMLAAALHLSRIELYTNFDRPLVPDEITRFKAMLQRRLKREPLQYILGETEFYSLPIAVKPGVLILRPETETLVEHVINQVEKSFEEAPIDILDVGTGSGCISVALARELPQANLTAVDVSVDALEIARANAETNEVSERIEFVELDALKPWPPEYSRRFDIVVSNPPYVSFSEFETLPPEIRGFEPKISLLGGNDGLAFYRKFATMMTNLLKLHGFVFFEIGEKQAAGVTNIFADVGFENIQIENDLAGKPRVVKMRWNKENS